MEPDKKVVVIHHLLPKPEAAIITYIKNICHFQSAMCGGGVHA